MEKAEMKKHIIVIILIGILIVFCVFILIGFDAAIIALSVVIGLVFIALCPLYAQERIKNFTFASQFEKATAEDNFTKTAAQVLGGAAVIFVFAYTLTKDNEEHELTRTQSAANAYEKAVKLLQEDSPTVRAGAIYLLERVASIDSSYKDPIANTLVGFLKQNNGEKSQPEKPALVDVDVRATIHVLGRTTFIPIKLSTILNLDGFKLDGADFSWLSGFSERRLQGTHLHVANFTGTNLTKTRMSGAEMNDSEAYGTQFSSSVPLANDWFYKKYWFAVQFDCANLTETQLDGSGLVGALFGRAKLNKTNFSRAVLSRADFSKARGLETSNFTDACADESPIWPDNFECPLRKCSEALRNATPSCNYKVNGNLKGKLKDRERQYTKDCESMANGEKNAE